MHFTTAKHTRALKLSLKRKAKQSFEIIDKHARVLEDDLEHVIFYPQRKKYGRLEQKARVTSRVLPFYSNPPF